MPERAARNTRGIWGETGDTEAIQAAREHDPGGLVTWRVADVTEPPAVDPDGRLAGTVTLLLDNGCLHGVPDQRRPGWALTVQALAAPHCVLLLRAAPRLRRSVGPRGIDPHEVTALLGDTWIPGSAPGAGWYRYTHDQPGPTDRPFRRVRGGLGVPPGPST